MRDSAGQRISLERRESSEVVAVSLSRDQFLSGSSDLGDAENVILNVLPTITQPVINQPVMTVVRDDGDEPHKQMPDLTGLAMMPPTESNELFH
jgi:hypothetical protein